jgi:DNA-binding FadR family transcriptional regulator
MNSPNPSQVTSPPSRSGDSNSVSAALRRQILNGEYLHDERLPAERTLADQFSCSRGTVRAAMERLEEQQLIERRVGSGTYVSYRGRADDVDIANLTSPLELIDVRLGIEPQIARLAVANASARDIARLEKSLIAVELCTESSDPESFTRADETFHLTLAECSGNALMLWVYKHINDVRSHRQWSAMKDKILKPARVRKYNQQHRALFEAIAHRDVDAATEVTWAHLDMARRDLLGASR